MKVANLVFMFGWYYSVLLQEVAYTVKLFKNEYTLLQYSFVIQTCANLVLFRKY